MYPTLPSNPPPALYAPRRPVWPWIVGGVVVTGVVVGGVVYARRARTAAPVNGPVPANGARTPDSFFGQVAPRVNLRVGEIHSFQLPVARDSYWSIYQGWANKTVAKERGAAAWVEMVELNGTTRFTIEGITPGHQDFELDYQQGSPTESGFARAGIYVVPVTVTA